CCECQEKECGDTKQQEQELTQADLARTLLLGASQVAQGREDHPRALVSLEQMQNDRNDGCCGERQQCGNQEPHQPSRSRWCRYARSACASGASVSTTSYSMPCGRSVARHSSIACCTASRYSRR